MSDDDVPGPPSSSEVAGEDFLFHLYRGSELLQDNRVHDAKAELEEALSLQPSDPKGQDLLGIVYFRLGLYPRAIAIYERLIRENPHATTPHVNLALAYLKTAQPGLARLALERALELDPHHSRAWGYLGLSLQQLGDYQRAGEAFTAGGHDAMARRLMEMATPTASASLRPEMIGPDELGNHGIGPGRAAVGEAASEAFEELDRSEVAWRRADEPSRPPTGSWSAIEPGLEEPPASVRPSRPPPSLRPSHRPATPPEAAPQPPTRPGPPQTGRDIETAGVPEVVPPAPPAGSNRTTTKTGATDRPAPPREREPVVRPGTLSPETLAPLPSAPSELQGPVTVSQLSRRMVLVFPRDANVVQHTSGLVLVRSRHRFSARFDVVRSMSYANGWATQLLKRRVRGEPTEQPLGGPGSPLFSIEGVGEIVLGPTSGQRLTPIQLERAPLYVRENAIVGFEEQVEYENGRLALGDGDGANMLQLRGEGCVVASLPLQVAAIEVSEQSAVALRALTVLGWVGRIVPSLLPPSESPAGVRGFASFSGSGMVWVHAR